MKKNYTYPITEILPFCALNALCESGGGENIGGGEDPDLGRAPRRATPF